jgi:hypothetical protein
LAWIGKASLADGNEVWRSQGSGMGEIVTRRKQTEARVRRGVFIGLQRRASSRVGARGGRQREGEDEHGVAVASSARRG